MPAVFIRLHHRCIPLLLSLLVLLPASLSAQEDTSAAESTPVPEVPPDMGFVRLVNAVGLAGVLQVRINGTEASPEGFKMGEATGAVGLLPASYKVELEHASLGKETLEVNIQTGQISTVIAYRTEKPEAKTTAKGKPEPGPRLAWMVDESPVSPPDMDRPHLTLLQVTPLDTLPLSVSGTATSARVAEPVRVAITPAMGAFPEVHHQGRAVCLLNFKFPADQLVVFFTDESGQLRHAPMRNDVQ